MPSDTANIELNEKGANSSVADAVQTPTNGVKPDTIEQTNGASGTTTAVKDPIQNAMGDFGRWHFFVCFVIFMLKFPVAWHQMSIIFIGPTAEFQCSNETIDRCASECPSHTFNRTTFSETIITEWDLVCESAQFANISQTVFMFGILLGSLIFGTWADKVGRRIPLVTAVFFQVASGIATSFVPTFWLYVFTRFVTAVSTGGTMTTSFVLVMELVGIRYRELISVMFHIPFNLGHLTLPLFAYFLRNWRHLQLALSLPSIILISYYWLVPESPRWLFAVDRVDESARVLERAAKHNRLPAEAIASDLHALKKTSDSPAAGQRSTGNIWDLLRTPNMRIKTLVMWFNWFVCGLAFFGVSQYVGQIGGDIYVNVAISAAVEVPGTLMSIYTMRRFGRKRTITFANLFTGVAMLAIAVLPEGGWRLVCASCGIIGMNMSFPTVYLYASEIFPTVVRNIGVGSSSMAARIGTMLAPFVVGLAQSSPLLPPFIFGSVAIAGAAVVLLLPETNGTVLPETLEDGERFGKKAAKVVDEQ